MELIVNVIQPKGNTLIIIETKVDRIDWLINPDSCIPEIIKQCVQKGYTITQDAKFEADHLPLNLN